jgi:hypothetical protein
MPIAPGGFDPNNRLFVLARQGQRHQSALGAIGVALVILALGIVGQATARFVLRATLVETIVGFLPIYLGLWIWLRLWCKRPFRSLGFERQGAFRYALRGALAAGAMIAVTAAIIIASGASVEPGFQASALGIGLLGLLSYAVQSSAEEALFRGWLLPVIGARYRPWIGVLASAILFSLAHATNLVGHTPNPYIAWLALFNLVLFGAFAAILALRQGALWGACAWHAVWNWAEGDLLGFTTDGTPHHGLLLSIRATGPDIITGGVFGPEGGLAAMAVLLIAACFAIASSLPRLRAPA